MLISKEVEVLVVGYTLKYYKSLGYNAKCNEKIIVKIADLKPSSKEIVKVQCDYCEKVFDFHFDAYRRYRENYLTAKYKCRECEIRGIWNNVVNKCEELNLILISDISDYETHKSNIKYICKIHPEIGIQDVSVNKLLCKNSACKLCGNKKIRESKLLEYDFVKSEFEKRNYKLIEKKYISAKTPMKYICPYHSDEIQEIMYDKLRSGQGCKYCANEKIGDHFRHSYEYIKELFNEKDLILLETEYKNNNTPLKYICKKHKEKGIQTITFNSLSVSDFGCKYCAIEYRSSLLSKGGITPLHNYLREKISPWIQDSIKSCGYKCILTKQRFHTVHHLYGFNMILMETLNNLNLPINPQINLYTDKELILIEQECLKLHYKHGFGICLCKDLHEIFHSLYLRGNNTPEQFEEFKQRYYNFEFDDLLEEKYKYKNIIKNIS